MNEIKLSIKVRRPTYVSSRIKIFSSQLCRVFLNFRARSLSGTLLHIFAPIRENKFFIWLMVRSRVFNRVSRQAKVILRKWDFFPLAFRNSFFPANQTKYVHFSFFLLYILCTISCRMGIIFWLNRPLQHQYAGYLFEFSLYIRKQANFLSGNHEMLVFVRDWFHSSVSRSPSWFTDTFFLPIFLFISIYY